MCHMPTISSKTGCPSDGPTASSMSYSRSNFQDSRDWFGQPSLNDVETLELVSSIGTKLLGQRVPWDIVELQRLTRWRHPSRNVQVNDLVLVQEDSLVTTRWPLARVVQVHPSASSLEPTEGLWQRPLSSCCTTHIHDTHIHAHFSHY